MKTLLISVTLLLLVPMSIFSQTFITAKISPAELIVGYSAIVGEGQARAANIAIRNDSKQTLKNVVVTVKIQFVQNVKGKSTPGENSEVFEIKELKPGATFQKSQYYAHQITKLTSAAVESVLQKK